MPKPCWTGMCGESAGVRKIKQKPVLQWCVCVCVCVCVFFVGGGSHKCDFDEPEDKVEKSGRASHLQSQKMPERPRLSCAKAQNLKEPPLKNTLK